MSRFFSKKYKDLTPYTPGEQPQDMQYVKLNTNESPFPPCEAVIAAVAESAASLRLYPDPDCKALVNALAAVYGVSPAQITVNNGSDETLNFAFMAYCDADHPAIFPDITYGFYPVFVALNGVPYTEVPLKDDFSIDLEAIMASNATAFIANPNAPTGIALSRDEIEAFVASRPDDVLVVDEAYVDFGAESCVPLVAKYPNLAVIQTFSKSRSLAGARLGFVIADEALIQDLNTLRFSTNPYDVSSFTQALGAAVLEDEAAVRQNCLKIQQNRAWTTEMLETLGFTVLPSRSNFVFARTDRMDGEKLYLALKEKGILVRHFGSPRIRDYNRITIGAIEDMQALKATLETILA
jgi:histidinol-phosphate aminotransferase